MVLANRFVRSATWAGMATDDGAPTPGLVNLIAGLAVGQVGLIITGHAYVREDGQHAPWQLGICQDTLIPGLKDITSAVHAHDSKIVVQLGFGGAYLSKARVGSMRTDDFHVLAEAFGQAALRAREAGFDGIQILAAHGFFLSQMLCPRYNDRSDEYGGNIANRAQALLEVVEAIRSAVGRDYPVLVKLNCEDFVEHGLTLDDSVKVAGMLEMAGVDAIELSGGLLNNPNVMQSTIGSGDPRAYFQSQAGAFKETIKIPLILVGGIRSYEAAEQLVGEGFADYISMSRPFIREPELVKRWKSGDRREAFCISCDNCFEPIKKGEGVSCQPLEPEEAVTFFPQLSEVVPAGPPHPDGSSYQISIGLEDWSGNFVPVVKIQMLSNKEVTGQGISFPLASEDHQKVIEALAELLDKHRDLQH